MASSKSSPSMQTRRGHKRVSIALFALFVVSMVMGTGPGVLLVNRPDTIGGVPLVYAWGILWYLVQVGIALVAYFVIWRSGDDREAESGSKDDHRRSGEMERGA